MEKDPQKRPSTTADKDATPRHQYLSCLKRRTYVIYFRAIEFVLYVKAGQSSLGQRRITVKSYLLLEGFGRLLVDEEDSRRTANLVVGVSRL